ncbi:putative lytic transglycosylase catalytic [Dinoroseobacter shibae DFL 12 = DSM 16493]|jgi:soluble lytic murein transglycosylase|uniref:Putative lytic transglycosylase catalytic n=1 Tax=Dinoroseobacter shibae (strain DSM 16493 / NCIMB 14021 / DFL 12) TaxID=398580 RepID=A8LKQ6_DINSH|nr:lytic transglycosylase domain-containing protein [Dinoroseobacter shibae]ABV91899.1 putative lytic transglycosylase catalytic [Dinoroseobacter shibae DFL 12 = DSM 16493]URF46877.1 lytic transglycosylase domain-containing protein [Dinoroseobacter shibae]URF51188.1 lytic transglycosylase domain-containing protein [Dinoroseobacter shibae]
MAGKAIRVFFMVMAAVGLVAQAAPVRADLAEALQATRSSDWDRATRAAAALEDQAARDVVIWTLLRARQGSWQDYRDFLARNSDWPGLPLLRARGEDAIPENAAPADVLAYFAPQAPRTGTGARRLAAAQAATGDAEGAVETLATAWRHLNLDREEQAIFLREHFREITPQNIARLDRLLWEGRTGDARAMLDSVPPAWQRLAEARIALRIDQPGVDGLIAAVPAALQDHPGLAYERFQWRLRKGRIDSARELLDAQSTSAAALGDPEAWANRRRSLARDLMRDDRDREAYRLAANHFLTEGNHYADLEWLSGFIALRKLNDPETALGHFRRFEDAVASPISLGRAGYWQGRALEALGRPNEARAAYAMGAEHQTAFYGQLAAERAGIAPDPALAGRETYPDWAASPYARTSVFRAARALQQAGQRSLAERFLVHLSERLTLEEMGALADVALAWDEPHIALKIAKFAAEDGRVLHRAYHPVTNLVPGQGLAVNRALALAIARRESEFDPAVVSPAGARGLMQLMPGTGELMAGKLGEPFSAARLLSDPAQNVRFGAAYLDQLIEEFGENLTLIAIGYNAGPGRSRSWTERFGSPKGLDEDAMVDWIEHVPFRETRNYIMRVTESRVIYEMRLTGRAQPFRVIERLTAR